MKRNLINNPPRFQSGTAALGPFLILLLVLCAYWQANAQDSLLACQFASENTLSCMKLGICPGLPNGGANGDNSFSPSMSFMTKDNCADPDKRARIVRQWEYCREGFLIPYQRIHHDQLAGQCKALGAILGEMRSTNFLIFRESLPEKSSESTLTPTQRKLCDADIKTVSASPDCGKGTKSVVLESKCSTFSDWGGILTSYMTCKFNTNKTGTAAGVSTSSPGVPDGVSAGIDDP